MEADEKAIWIARRLLGFILSGNCCHPDRQPLIVPLSACVSEGDRIRVFNGDAWVVCKNGEAQILRPYVVEDTLRLGGIRLEILIKEITEPEEYHAYRALADFHYRGHLLHGRTARLIIRTFH